MVSKRSVRFLACMFILSALWISPSLADYMTTEFCIPSVKGDFRARVSNDPVDFSLPQQLDIAERDEEGQQWLITDRMELDNVRCPTLLKLVTLATDKGSIPALLVLGKGATTFSVHVIKVSAADSPYSSADLQQILEASNEVEAARPHYSENGSLESLTLQYLALHMVADDTFPGHIILAKTYKWVPAKRKFVAGPLHVDSEAEKQLTWQEAIMFPGSDRLGVSYKYDERTKNSIRTFKPSGILRDKLPKNLRSFPKIEVISDSSGNVISIEGIGSTGSR